MKNFIHWKAPATFSRLQLTKEVSTWLLYKQSMTQQFKQQCNKQNKEFTIRIIKEAEEQIKQEGHTKNNCELFYTREVLITASEEILMYAKSFLPKTAPSIIKTRFKGLQHKPLGEFLFADKSIERSDFMLAKIFPEAKEYEILNSKNNKQNFIWARNSFFLYQETFIFLSEFFSPYLFCFMKDGPSK